LVGQKLQQKSPISVRINHSNCYALLSYHTNMK